MPEVPYFSKAFEATEQIILSTAYDVSYWSENPKNIVTLIP
jgi:hypothetical protein